MMDTFDKVVKATEKLDIMARGFMYPRHMLLSMSVLWAGYTVAEAIKEASPKRGTPVIPPELSKKIHPGS